MKKRKEYCVYCHTNKVNGKKYVGQTCQNPPEKRWGKGGQGYMHKRANGEFRNPHFVYSILKYGWDNFEHEILEDGLTQDEANKKERQYILLYNSNQKEKGYNLTTGGENPVINEESRQKLSDSKKGKVPWIAVKAAQQANTGRKSTPEHREKVGKSIICVETGQKYNSAAEAGEKLGLDPSSITKCCRGVAHTTGNFHWKYADKELSKTFEELQKRPDGRTTQNRRDEISKSNRGRKQSDEPRRRKSSLMKGEKNPFYGKKHSLESKIKMSKPVVCIETKKWFLNSEEVHEVLGIVSSSIRRCCNGQQKIAGGYHWRYATEEENKENIQSVLETNVS